MGGRPGTAVLDTAAAAAGGGGSGTDSDNEDVDGGRLGIVDAAAARSRDDPAGVGGGAGDGGGLAAAAAAAGGLSEKKADVIAEAVDMTSASGAGVDGRRTSLSPPTIALEMKPEMLENRLMTTASLPSGDHATPLHTHTHTHTHTRIET